MEHENHCKRKKKFALIFFFHIRDSIREKLWASIWHFVSSMMLPKWGLKKEIKWKTVKSHKKLTLEVHKREEKSAQPRERDAILNKINFASARLAATPCRPLFCLFFFLVLRKIHQAIRAASIVFYLWRHPVLSVEKY